MSLVGAAVPGSITLRDYQQTTVEALLSPPVGVSRDLAVLATGAGKTIIFAALLHHTVAPGRRALVLAHREELLTQARDKIAMVDPGLSVEIEQSDSRAARDLGLYASTTRNVVVASVQSLHKRRREQFTPDAFDVIIIDEAHHATADSYIEILDYFGCFKSENPTRLIGVTATPNRTDGKGLGEVFQRIAATYGIRELVERGYLVPPAAHRISSSADLSGVKTTAGDYNLGELQAAVNRDDRNALIVAAWKKYAADRQTIVFCAGVEHAGAVAGYFNAAGIPAAPVWGAAGAEVRRDTLERFQRQELRVLTNFGVLTEGFDDPAVSCVILARPTKSDLLMTQMVGRGLRLFDGKTECVCIDVQDVTGKTSCVSVPSLAGLPANFDAQGRSIFTAKKQVDQLDPRLIGKALSASEVETLIAKMAAGMTAVEIDVMAVTAPDPLVEANSTLLWTRISNDEFALRVGDSHLTISPDTLGKWAVSVREGKVSSVLYAGLRDEREAFTLADAYINKHHSESLYLLDRTARWRGDKPSAGQIEWLIKKRVFLSESEIPATLTKGQASQLLDEAFGKTRGMRRGA